MSQYVFGTGQLRFGALQDVNVDFSGDVKMLYGQYQFPLDTARGKTKIEWKASSGNIDVAAFNSIFFGETVDDGDELIQVFGEAVTIPAVGAGPTSTAITQVGGTATATFAAAHGFTVDELITVTGATAAGYNVTNKPVLSVPTPTTLTYTVPGGTTSPATVQGTFTGTNKAQVENAANFYLDLGVFNETDSAAMKQVDAGPATGEYSVTAGVYTFAAADAGDSVAITYLYESPSTGGSMEISNQLMGTTPRFQLVLSQEYEGKTFTLILYSNVADKLTLPLKQDDYLIGEITGSAHANDANKIGRITTTSTAGGGS